MDYEKLLKGNVTMSKLTNKRRILLIAANPVGAEELKLPKEFRNINESIQLAKNRDLFDVEKIGATRYKDLRRKLLSFKPHIVHFSGHGTNNGILLEGENGEVQIASHQRLYDLLIKFTDHLECVILNACNSKRTAQSLDSHIPYSIGMNAPISDKDAIDFSLGFYDAIVNGRTYCDAFDFGLNAIDNIKDKTQRSFELEGDDTNNNPIPELFIQNHAKEEGMPTVSQSMQENTTDYLKAQYKVLSKYLIYLQETEKTQILYQTLTSDFFDEDQQGEADLISVLLAKLNDDAASFVELLRLSCECHSEILSIESEALLLLLLTQLMHKEQWLNNSLHELNVRTRVMSEIQMSTRYALAPFLKKHDNLGMAGAYIITEDLSCKEVGINADDNAKQIAETIAFKLYKYFDDTGDLPLDEMDEEEWEGVNETITGLRKGRNPEFHRIEIDVKRAKNHLLLDPDICHALHQLLPDLPITHFGRKGLQGETRLRSQVSLFFDMLYPAT